MDRLPLYYESAYILGSEHGPTPVRFPLVLSTHPDRSATRCVARDNSQSLCDTANTD